MGVTTGILFEASKGMPRSAAGETCQSEVRNSQEGCQVGAAQYA
jgi:hypothetical protein